MMGVACLPVVWALPSNHARVGGVTAIVGLAGALHGTCVMRMGQPVALKLAERMVGVAHGEL